MTYNDAVKWMFSQLPMYQKQGKSAYKIDLSNSLLLAKHLKYPEKKFKSIHVAGTNGKGSTCHMLASILQEAGYNVGLYTSPHLKDYRERIKINGKLISKHFVINFVKKNKPFFKSNTLSFFEMTVGLAFSYFAKKKVDIAIIEVGLGGRLDSTNIIMPELSIITNIGFDHTQFLGNTLQAIAKEKAGIIKANIPVIIGETQKETALVFKTIAKEKNSKIIFVDNETTESYKSDLIGNYQIKNIKTAVQVIRQLQQKEFSVSKDNIKYGLLNVVRNTGLLGRWQILQHKPKVICDTAHNKEGLTYTMQQLLQENFNKLHIVFGVVNDKKLDTIINIMPKNAIYYFCNANIYRALNKDVLYKYFSEKDFKGHSYNSVDEAYKTALANAANNDIIYIGGSTFVVAEII